MDRQKSLHFLAQRVWLYRYKGLLVTVLGVLVASTQVSTFAMVRPLLDLLFTNTPETVVAGLTWLDGDLKIRLLHFVRDHVLPERMHWLRVFCALILILGLVNVLLDMAHRFLSRTLTQHFQLGLYRELYDHLLTLSVADIHKRKQGDISSRFAYDTRMMQDALQEFFLVMLKEPFTVIFTLGSCILINWEVTLVAMTVFPVVGLVIALLSRRVRKLSFVESETAGGLLHQVGESISGLPVIKVYQSEAFLRGKLAHHCEKYMSTMRKIIRIEAITSPFLEYLGFVAIAGVLLIMAPAVYRGQISLGSLVAILVLLIAAYKPIKNISNSMQRISRSLGAADRFMELMKAKPESKGGTRPFPGKIGSIEFVDVQFGYGAEKVLRGLNIKINEGETVAVVGATGAGKTTLMQLLPRFYDINEGAILLAGVPLREYSLESLRQNMALVSQNVFLFNDTVCNNIAMGLAHPIEKVRAAAKAAHADMFIEKMEQGYDSLVGDRGVRLSGGQCQRIALARAFLKNPPLLLLDEATSALDAETEKFVQQSVEELARNRTTLIIAHRLTTIQNADRILVMEHGRIVEEGRHGELVRRNGLYARLNASGFATEQDA